MGLGILGWQILILVTIVAAGRSRGIAVIFWVIWTAVRVFALPLSLLQFGTIWLGYLISRALFPDRASVASAKPVPPSPAPKLESSKIVLSSAEPRQTPVDGVERQAWDPAKTRLVMQHLLKQLPSGSLEAHLDTLGGSRKGSPKTHEIKGGKLAATDGPSYGELSGSLVAYLESLDDTSKERGATASSRRLIHPDHVIFPSRALNASRESVAEDRAGLMCEACADESTRVVSGLRYCSDCGAFLGMQS